MGCGHSGHAVYISSSFWTPGLTSMCGCRTIYLHAWGSVDALSTREPDTPRIQRLPIGKFKRWVKVLKSFLFYLDETTDKSDNTACSRADAAFINFLLEAYVTSQYYEGDIFSDDKPGATPRPSHMDSDDSLNSQNSAL